MNTRDEERTPKALRNKQVTYTGPGIKTAQKQQHFVYQSDINEEQRYFQTCKVLKHVMNEMHPFTGNCCLIQSPPNAGEAVELQGLSLAAGGSVKWYNHPGRQFGNFLQN